MRKTAALPKTPQEIHDNTPNNEQGQNADDKTTQTRSTETPRQSTGPSALASALRKSVNENQKAKAQSETRQRRSLECSKDLRKAVPSPAYRQVCGRDVPGIVLEVKVANFETTICGECSDCLVDDTLYCTKKDTQRKSPIITKHFRCLNDSELRILSQSKECLDSQYWTAANFSQKHARVIIEKLNSFSARKGLSSKTPEGKSHMSSLKVDLQEVSTNFRDSLLKTVIKDEGAKMKKKSSLKDSTKTRSKKSVFIEELDQTDEDEANSSTGTFVVKTVLDENGDAFEGQSFGELSSTVADVARQGALQASGCRLSRRGSIHLTDQEKDLLKNGCETAVDEPREIIEQTSHNRTITKRFSRTADSASRPITPKDKCADSANYLESVKKSTRSGSFPVFSRIGTPAAPPQNSLFEPRNSTPSHSPPWLKRFSAKSEKKPRPVSPVLSPIRRVSEKRKMLTNDEFEPLPKMRKTSRVTRAPSVALRGKPTQGEIVPLTPSRNSLIFSPTKGLARMRLPETPAVKRDDLGRIFTPIL